jgi:hypothetical protein
MRNKPHYDTPWTHPICIDCYNQEEPGREPTRVKGDWIQVCCFCGQTTKDGIYYRFDPSELHPV